MNITSIQEKSRKDDDEGKRLMRDEVSLYVDSIHPVPASFPLLWISGLIKHLHFPVSSFLFMYKYKFLERETIEPTGGLCTTLHKKSILRNSQGTEHERKTRLETDKRLL